MTSLEICVNPVTNKCLTAVLATRVSPPSTKPFFALGLNTQLNDMPMNL